MTASTKIIDLRRLMAERFPEAHRPVTPSHVFSTGMACLDTWEIRKGTLNEVVGQRTSAGTALLLYGVMRHVAGSGRRLALIDGRDGFDPASLGEKACRQMLWVRCREVRETLAAADLVLRDGNLPLVVMDLALNSKREIKRVPNHAWHRLRRLAEAFSTVLLAFTPSPSIGAADLRLEVGTSLNLEALDQRQDLLMSGLQAAELKQRGNRNRLAYTPLEAAASA